VADGAQGQRRPPAGRVLQAIAGLEHLVSASLPLDLPPDATWWDAHCAAMISRMTDSVESIAALIRADRAVDAGALIRVLYEAVTKFCWIAVDPDVRYAPWQADAIAWDRKLVNDARAHGVELETPVVDEDALGVPVVEMPPMVQLAKEVDEHWGGQLVGFEAAGHGLGSLVTFRELYVPLYRTLSEAVHSRPDVMRAYMAVGSHFWLMGEGAGDASMFFPLVVPLYAQALLVCHQRLGWPDPDQIVAINNGMYAP
jgi:Family of unknown function (DUF5677)